MSLSEEQLNRAERLAREVIARVEQRSADHLCDLVLRVAPDVPPDAFRDAFVTCLADGGVDFVDVTVLPDAACRVERLRFAPP